MGKVCVCGAERDQVDYGKKTMKVGGQTFNEGDFLSIDGTAGLVYAGELKTASLRGHPGAHRQQCNRQEKPHLSELRAIDEEQYGHVIVLLLTSVTVIDLSTNLPIKTITDASLNQGYTVTIYSGNAYVTNSAGSTITIINTSSNTVTGTITGFDGPSGLVINGNIGYVNNYGASGGVESGNGHTISVVNMLTNTIIGTINVNQAPAALALSPNGQYLYCVNYVTGIANNGTINVIQTSNNTITQTINGFFGPFAISITPNGKFAYVTNFGSNNFSPFGTTISVVDLTSYTIVSTINAGIQPSGIAITQSGKYAYVLNYNTLYAGANFTNLTAGQGTINIIDTSSNKIIPPTILVGQSPSNITISPNGKLAYISNFISNTVSVITLLN